MISGKTIINGVLSFVYTENTGAAFGMLENKRFVFIAVTIIILAIFIYILVTKKIKSLIFNTAAGLIIGGGIGNMIDRILNGYVIDYIKISFFPAVFNIADMAITIGAIMLFIYLLNDSKKERD